MKILLATTNPAKIQSYGKKLQDRGIDIVTLKDLNITLDVVENGETPLENAIKKATEYHKISNIPTVAIDDGLFLENVPDILQPGTNVRRVNGKRLDDKEMIEYYISLVNKFGENGKLSGFFSKGIAVVDEKDTYTFEYKTKRVFTNRKSSIINKGYPLASIQIIPFFNKFKSELTEDEEKLTMCAEQKDLFDFLMNTITIIDQKSSKKKCLKI